MLADPGLGKHLTNPSVSYGTANLYMRGALEEATRSNLDKPMVSLVDGNGDGVMLTVNDKALIAPLRVRLKMNGTMEDGACNGMQQ